LRAGGYTPSRRQHERARGRRQCALGIHSVSP